MEELFLHFCNKRHDAGQQLLTLCTGSLINNQTIPYVQWEGDRLAVGQSAITYQGEEVRIRHVLS